MPSYAITGASRGIGLEYVKQLSNVPENTVFALVRNRAGSTLLHQLNRPNVHIVEADITDLPALKRAATTIADVTGGSLDVLINNAALLPGPESEFTLDAYPSEELMAKDLTDNFTTNVVCVAHTINTFLPLLHKGTLKKVITISSGVADLELSQTMGLPTLTAYSISKAAVNMLNMKYGMRFREEGFVFLALSPGVVNTISTSSEPGSVEEKEKVLEGIVQLLKSKYPDFDGALTVEKSVGMQLEVIEQATVEDTGDFVSHHGDNNWL